MWGAAVAFGLGALIAVSELAFNLLKYCGAAYLAWMGNVLNPKVGIFYVSFLPQFIPQGHSLIAWTFGLVSIHVALGLLWSSMLIGATQPLAGILRRENVIKWMDCTTGMVFVLFATRLAFSKR